VESKKRFETFADIFNGESKNPLKNVDEDADFVFLHTVLNGHKSYLSKLGLAEEIVFPEGNDQPVAHFYAQGNVGGFQTRLFDEAVEEVQKERTHQCANGTNGHVGLGRVLEVGAGTGAGTRSLEKWTSENDEVFVTDVSPRFVRKLRKQFSALPNWTFGALDINQFETVNSLCANKKFDLICALNTLHLATRPDECIKLIYELLAPEGSLVLSEGFLNSDHPNWIFDLSFGCLPSFQSAQKGATSGFSPQQWKNLLENVGFSEVRVAPEKELHSPKRGACLWAKKGTVERETKWK
jgi:SAM-dependent methyltransferase